MSRVPICASAIAERQAEQLEHDALGQQLTDDAAASGAERGAHGQLAPAAGGARQLQIRDVRARDESTSVTPPS